MSPEKSKFLLWTLVVAVVLAFGAVGLSVYNFWAKFSAGVKKELTDADAGFRRLTNTMDPEVLRVWALESARTNAPQKDIVESMPKEIRNLYDEPPEVQPDSSGLTLSWGGGFFHWVLYIHNTNETLPFVSDNQGYPYNFEWRPGIYYTREANRPLQ